MFGAQTTMKNSITRVLDMNRELVDGVSTFHFDFHKNLACPKLSCQESYYSSKLTTYAFGIHSGETGKGTVYIWPESVAPKHPDTLLSCLDLHLKETETENRAWNIFWADNTRSQNKNYTVVMYLENLVSSGVRKRVDYKFLVAGHSYGEVDRNAGRAEAILRRESNIETPADYVTLINNSALSSKTTWIEVNQRQFSCYSEWLRGKYIESRKDVRKQPFLFSEMSHFNFGIGERIDPADDKVKTYRHPGFVWMRRTLDPREEPTVMSLTRKGGLLNLNTNSLKPLNNGIIKLSDKKRKDLSDLCKYLSPRGKAYYQTIVR